MSDETRTMEQIMDAAYAAYLGVCDICGEVVLRDGEPWADTGSPECGYAHLRCEGRAEDTP